MKEQENNVDIAKDTTQGEPENAPKSEKTADCKVDVLYTSVSDIDEDLISEAEGKTSGAGKGVFKGLLALAACIALFVLLSFPLSNFIPKLAGNQKAESYVAGDASTTNVPSDYSMGSAESQNGITDEKGSASTTVKDDEKQNPYFNATVLEVNILSEKDGKLTGTVTVEPAAGSDELKSADKINVSLDVVSTNPVPQMKKGDKIRIVYNGDIAESYPAQINTTFAIYALDADGNVIFGTPTTESTK